MITAGEGARQWELVSDSVVFRADLLEGLGRRGEAEAQFEKAIQCNPDCAEALRELRLLSEQRELGGRGGKRG